MIYHIDAVNGDLASASENGKSANQVEQSGIAKRCSTGARVFAVPNALSFSSHTCLISGRSEESVVVLIHGIGNFTEWNECSGTVSLSSGISKLNESSSATKENENSNENFHSIHGLQVL